LDYLDGLNPSQRAAVEQIEGPMMIVAGAGSGKTRVITYRVAHLIRKGVDPFNILVLTFTNKAAKEMRERIMKVVGSESKNIWMGTFHSIFSRILRNVFKFVILLKAIFIHIIIVHPNLIIVSVTFM
jgi:DNA helicase-2/ATP-dependent DNA helicase PcrA